MELASIHSSDEDFSASWHIFTEYMTEVWIGLNSLENKHEWVWSDASPLDYEQWLPDSEMVGGRATFMRNVELDDIKRCVVKAPSPDP